MFQALGNVLLTDWSVYVVVTTYDLLRSHLTSQPFSEHLADLSMLALRMVTARALVVLSGSFTSQVEGVCVCVYVCVYVSCMSVKVCTYVCACTCMYVCAYVFLF